MLIMKGAGEVKLTVNQHMDVPENEVIINCAYLDERMQKLIDYIRQFSFSLEGEDAGKIYRVPMEKIFYIDSVDGRTFFYDQDKSYRIKKTLSMLEEELCCTTFARISKNCLLNTSQLRCVEPCGNHRMKAELKNGEHLLISRSYIEALKRKLR